jgi:predicted amidohydrolase
VILSAVQFGARLYAPEANRARIAEAVRGAAAEGADLVVLPELAVPGYGLAPARLAETAEPADGPTRALLGDLAEETGAVVVCGFCEAAGGALYNAAMLVGPGGETALYRKLHLFDAEKEVFAPGDLGLVVAETPIGAVGICVCYDLRFVEVARGLSLAGADLLAVPTAWVGGFDRVARDGEGLIGQARGALVQANLDQLAMVCAGMSGGDQGIRFLGSSLIADAWGACRAGPLGEDAEATIFAETTLEEIRAARVRTDRIRPREDRRTDVYGIAVNGRIH